MSDDYEIGYRKPPKQTRFQKGQSGNPFGRPRGSHNVLTDMRDELSGHITTQDGAKISKGRALVKALYAQALKGNVRAATLLLDKIPVIAELAVNEEEDKRAKAATAIREGLMELAMLGKQMRKEREEEEMKKKEAPQR